MNLNSSLTLGSMHRLLLLFPLLFLFSARPIESVGIQVRYTGTDTTILRAMDRANLVMRHPLFYKLLQAHTDTFDHSNVNGEMLAGYFQKEQAVAEVLTYKSLTRFSRSTAYTSFDGRIFVNIKRLDRPIDDVAITLIHECVHVLDSRTRGVWMGHGSNNPKGKSQTAPYAIELIADSVLRSIP
jgi:hypothetical protein